MFLPRRGIRNTATACTTVQRVLFRKGLILRLFQMHERHLGPDPLCLYMSAEGLGNWGLPCVHLKLMGDMCPLSQTVKHPLCTKHPPSVKYTRCFLSELIRKVSSGHWPSSSQIASGTWLALQRYVICPTWPFGAHIHPKSFVCLQPPPMAGGPLGNWLPIRGRGGQKERRGQGTSPTLLRGVSGSSCISSVVPHEGSPSY